MTETRIAMLILLAVTLPLWCCAVVVAIRHPARFGRWFDYSIATLTAFNVLLIALQMIPTRG